MKTLMTLTFALIALNSRQAMADQYQVLVTHSTHVSESQSNLASLVQKDIVIDTAAKTVSLQLTPVCSAISFCPHFIRLLALPLTQIQTAHGTIQSVSAACADTINGTKTSTSIKITLNADNAMNIVITDTVGTVTSQSTFLGSPAVAVVAN